MRRYSRYSLLVMQAVVGLMLVMMPVLLLGVLWYLLPTEENMVKVEDVYWGYKMISWVVLVTVILVIVIMFTLNKKLVFKPLRTLGERARGYADGVSVLVREDYHVHEIDNLAKAINDLMDTVMSREDSLHQLNEHLEEKVRQRTEAHEETIKTLQSARDQLMLSEKMAVLGSLVSGVAHEINAPLSIGVTAASFMGERTKVLYDEWDNQTLTQENLERFLKDAQESSRIIQSNLDNASKIINSLKQVAVDQQVDERREIELGSYISDIILSLKHQLKPGGHTISLETEGILVVDTYPGAITQILNNLVFNSVSHGFDKRESGKVRIKLRGDGDSVVLEYRDDGRGLTDEEYDRIFDQFFTTKRDRGGSGLGMSIVKDLVSSRLKGSIEVAAPGMGGAGFTIRFPKLVQQ